MLIARAARRLAATILAATVSTALPVGPSHAERLELTAPGAKTGKVGLEPGNAPMGWRHSQFLPDRQARALARQTSATARRSAPFHPDGVLGMDVASYQREVDWPAWVAQGKRFAFIKATEGTSYRNPYFSSQYRGSYDAGMIRGAYHFASPSGRSGRAQARYFVRHGGGWSRDGKTLPGVLDIEYNPYGKNVCYGLSQKAMIAWISSFVTEYKRLTTRDAIIYTTTDWWKRCTGNTAKFSRTNPLWIARYARQVGTLPGTWRYYTFWQYTSSPLDQNRFSSSYRRLVVLANGWESVAARQR